MGKGGIHLLERLVNAGYSAYLVGGCVRDGVLGRPMKDIDIATSAKPDRVMQLFPQAIPTGLQHGTVTVPLKHYVYEITTFRAESDYADGRRPNLVTFVEDIVADLERRDFTINAMALGLNGQLMDPFGGLNDLREGILRAVGNPSERFREDALRMLRCVRIAAEYQLRIDDNTWREVMLGASRLKWIAMERVYIEMERMIGGNDPYRALQLLSESELLHYCKEPLSIPSSLGIDPTEDAANCLIHLGDLQELQARWALWFLRMDVAPEHVRHIGRLLRMPSIHIYAIAGIVQFHRSLRSQIPNLSQDIWILSTIKSAKPHTQAWLRIASLCQQDAIFRWAMPYIQYGHDWLEGMPVTMLSELKVNGSLILQMTGRKGGPWLSVILQRLLEEAATGRCPNSTEQLLERASYFIGHESMSHPQMECDASE
jgi:tRNA nucleotidyltransferase (CCA-adding enzyme)